MSTLIAWLLLSLRSVKVGSTCSLATEAWSVHYSHAFKPYGIVQALMAEGLVMCLS